MWKNKKLQIPEFPKSLNCYFFLSSHILTYRNLREVARASNRFLHYERDRIRKRNEKSSRRWWERQRQRRWREGGRRQAAASFRPWLANGEEGFPVMRLVSRVDLASWRRRRAERPVPLASQKSTLDNTTWYGWSNLSTVAASEREKTAALTGGGPCHAIPPVRRGQREDPAEKHRGTYAPP